jgi:ferredoxin
MHDDGLAYVKEVDDRTGLINGEPKLKMGKGLANVPDRLLDAVIESAEECPGECIFIQKVE